MIDIRLHYMYFFDGYPYNLFNPTFNRIIIVVLGNILDNIIYYENNIDSYSFYCARIQLYYP